MYGISRSGLGLRVGQVLDRISSSEASSEKSSELSAHQISLGSQLGFSLRAEPSSNLTPSSPRTKSSELSAHQTPHRKSSATFYLIRLHFDLRSYSTSLPMESIATTSAYLGRTNRPDSSRAVCTLRARSRRGPPQPGSTPLPMWSSLRG